jgi:hypothetical protein
MSSIVLNSQYPSMNLTSNMSSVAILDAGIELSLIEGYSCYDFILHDDYPRWLSDTSV